MKSNITKIAFVFISFLFSHSCLSMQFLGNLAHSFLSRQSSGNGTETPSGEIIEKKYPVDEILNGVHLTSGTLTIIKAEIGEEQELVVKTQTSIMSLVDPIITDNYLNLGLAGDTCIQEDFKLEYILKVKSLCEIDVTGSGKVRFNINLQRYPISNYRDTRPLDFESFFLEVSGTGEIAVLERQKNFNGLIIQTIKANRRIFTTEDL